MSNRIEILLETRLLGVRALIRPVQKCTCSAKTKPERVFPNGEEVLPLFPPHSPVTLSATSQAGVCCAHEDEKIRFLAPDVCADVRV